MQLELPLALAKPCHLPTHVKLMVAFAAHSTTLDYHQPNTLYLCVCIIQLVYLCLCIGVFAAHSTPLFLFNCEFEKPLT